MPDDPLASLRDLHLPEPVSWWPPAPGWWLLALCLAGIPLLWWLRVRWQQRRPPRYRRDALAALEQSYADCRDGNDEPLFLQQTSTLLKRVAVQCYDPQEVAALSGEAWGDFLSSGLEDSDRREIRRMFSETHRREVSFDPECLYTFAKDWIQSRDALK